MKMALTLMAGILVHPHKPAPLPVSTIPRLVSVPPYPLHFRKPGCGLSILFLSENAVAGLMGFLDLGLHYGNLCAIVDCVHLIEEG